MDLLAAENAIVTRLDNQVKSSLKSDFGAPKIQSFPQNPTDHFESISPVGEILVRFESMSAEAPEPNRVGTIVQDILINWSIWIISPNLITHTGVYTYIDKVKDALTGWTITDWYDSSPMYLQNTNFIQEEGGFWYYEMLFQHQLAESEL